jgi:hypothetical protein
VAVGDQIADAAHRIQRAEGHDERMRQPQERDPKTVDEADQHSNGRPDQNDDRPRPACLIGHGEQHDGERHDRADRKIDAGGEDDEVHPEREQRVHPNLADDVGDVLRREEVLRLQDRQGCGHHHDDDQDAVFAKQPRTEIALQLRRRRERVALCRVRHLNAPCRGQGTRCVPWSP